ncbi:MAG: NUDIX hydrolase [Clostridiales bacterium]|nr:NUDIX hydrolase [Clostridiales bacterium]
MSAFLEDIRPFYGNQECNAAGQTLEQFLQAYDPKRYEQPSVTVDTIVVQHPKQFTSIYDGLKILMIQRGNHPSIGKWALPGGFINMKEDGMDSAKRELEEETGLTGIPIEQIHAWDEWKRDPRTRIVTIAYLALVEEGLTPKAGDDAADACFFDVNLTLIETKHDENKNYYTYRLTLFNEQKEVTLQAMLVLSENSTGLLRQKQLEIIENDGVACDHAKIIMQSLLYIEQLIKK